MRKSTLTACILMPMALGIGFWNGLIHNQKSLEKRVVEYKQILQDNNEAFRKAIDELYNNPNSETAENAKGAATLNVIYIHLYRNTDYSGLSEDKIKKVYKEFISNCGRCLEGFELLSEQFNSTKYACASALERQRTLATYTLNRCPELFSGRMWDEIDVSFHRRQRPTEVDKELYRMRQMVRDYVNVGQLMDPNRPPRDIGEVADDLVVKTYNQTNR